jgi:hypothetical protein
MTALLWLEHLRKNPTRIGPDAFTGGTVLPVASSHERIILPLYPIKSSSWLAFTNTSPDRCCGSGSRKRSYGKLAKRKT